MFSRGLLFAPANTVSLFHSHLLAVLRLCRPVQLHPRHVVSTSGMDALRKPFPISHSEPGRRPALDQLMRQAIRPSRRGTTAGGGGPLIPSRGNRDAKNPPSYSSLWGVPNGVRLAGAVVGPRVPRIIVQRTNRGRRNHRGGRPEQLSNEEVLEYALGVGSFR